MAGISNTKLSLGFLVVVLGLIGLAIWSGAEDEKPCFEACVDANAKHEDDRPSVEEECRAFCDAVNRDEVLRNGKGEP